LTIVILVALIGAGFTVTGHLLSSPGDWMSLAGPKPLEFYSAEALRFRNHYLVYSTLAYAGYAVVVFCTTLVASGIFRKGIGQVLAAAAAIVSAVIAVTGPDKAATNFERAHANLAIAITDALSSAPDSSNPVIKDVQKVYADAKRLTTFGVNLNTSPPPGQ